MQEKRTNICLMIGGIRLHVESDIPLEALPGTEAFLIEACLEKAKHGNEENVVSIRILAVDVLPVPGMASLQKCGDDGMFCFYRARSHFYEVAKPAVDGSVSFAVWTEDHRHVTLYINEGAFPDVVRTVDKVLQLLPMKQLLSHFGAFLLHSSRIAVDGRAILFTAPSQTGKTTQAKLWERYGGARIAGNDRTLLRFADDRIRAADAPMVTDRISDSRKQSNRVITSGYPVDGSSPVYSSEELPLEAIVVLRQAPENRIQRLSAVKALRYLMEQTALDAWNGAERSAAQEFWLRVLEQVPVYLLECTPDEGAVQCLKQQLDDEY